MRRLLKSRFILRSSNERWFQIILENREALQKNLQSIGVFLTINEGLGVVHLTALNPEAEEQINYNLGRRRQLSPISSLLLLHLRNLRHQFYLNPNDDLTPIVALSELREFTTTFSQYKIDSQFERSFRRSIDELTELQILRETQSGTDKFEITPICELLLGVDQIQEIKTKAEQYFQTLKPPETVNISGEANA
jgi:hypothetical protein